MITIEEPFTTNNISKMQQRLVNASKCVLLIILYLFSCKFLIYDPYMTSFFLTIAFIYLISKLIWNKAHQIQSIALIILVICFTSMIFLSTNKTDSIDFYLKRTNFYQMLKYKQKSNFNYQGNNFNIFFTETNPNRTELNLKQMCAIESAALNNPDANVYLYSVNATIDNHLLERYGNIEYIQSTPAKIFEETPLHSWWISNQSVIQNSEYSIHHIADSLRIALLYKYGGYYSDLDTITIRNIKPLIEQNGVGLITEFMLPSIGNGILIFNKEHLLLKEAMSDMILNYDPTKWGFNGPLLFIRSIKKYCLLNDIYENLKLDENRNRTTSKCDVNIFPESYFYPINWENASKLFRENALLDVRTFLNTYSVHFYGKFSDDFNVNFNENSIYEFFASLNCPYTYSLLKNNLNSHF